MGTLFKKFKIYLSKLEGVTVFEKYNLIGIDYGDGEISACKIEWDYEKNCLKLRPLAFDRQCKRYKTMNVIYISKKTSKLVMATTGVEEDGVRYYNFKYPPNSPEAKARYIKDDGTEAPLTNEEVMSKGFACVVKTLFEFNQAEIDPKKPTIILVGCPSGSKWKNSATAYAELLKRELANNISIAVQMESTAALARETDPNKAGRRVRASEIVVILDCGSSTFDVTIATPSGIPDGGEDSFQFGGREIDANILLDMKKSLLQKYPDQNCNLHGIKIELRRKKEEFFGDDGKNEEEQLYAFTIKNSDGTTKTDQRKRVVSYRYSINPDNMDKVLFNQVYDADNASYIENVEEGMRVSVSHLVDRVGNMQLQTTKEYASWADGCEGTFRDMYDQISRFFKKRDKNGKLIPDRVIMTGGVSVMPVVQEKAQKVFGVKPVVADRPNYSVSEGLAYVLGNEFLKSIYLEKIMKELEESILPNTASLREAIIQAGIEEDWTTFYDTTKDWADSAENKSLQDWFALHDKKFISNLSCVFTATQKWYEVNQCQKSMQEHLARSFRTMFPDYTNQWNYQWKNPSFATLHGVRVMIKSKPDFFFNNFKEFQDFSMTTPIGYALRQKMFDCFKERKNRIREGGSYSYSYGFLNWRSKSGSYEGLRNAYASKLTEEVVQRIRKEVVELHREPLEAYVESITPYFNMTSKK